MSDNRIFRVIQTAPDVFTLVLASNGQPVADFRIPGGADFMDVSGLVADVSEAYKKLFNQLSR